MKEYLKKFDSAEAADNYHIVDIPFATSVATIPIQNLVCRKKSRKLVNVSGIVQVQSIIPDAIDLGLSVKWTSFNVGASSIGEYGSHFAWGEEEDKSDYSWSTYKYGSDRNKLTKYCPADKTDYWVGEGSPDNKLVLDAVDDVATQTYGSDYRMPTRAELDELITLPNKWMSVNGVNGQVFCRANEPDAIKGDFSIVEEGLYLYDENNPNPNSNYGSYNIHDNFDSIGLEYQTKEEVIAKLTTYYASYYGYDGTIDVDTMLFKDEEHTTRAVAGTDYAFGSFPSFNPSSMLFIPAAGYFYETRLRDVGYSCNLWTSSLYSSAPYHALYIYFISNKFLINSNNRYNGFSIRAVKV